MRILLLADIHGNRHALEAISEEYDVCIFLGDLVDYGVQPGPCIDWVREHAHYTVRGNHDHGVAQNVIVDGKNGYRYLTSVTRTLSRKLITEEQQHFLSRMPLTKMVTLNDIRFFLVHASPRDPLDEYAPNDIEFWERRLENIDADVICVGHTHQQYVLQVGEKLVINPGSVGQPRDGDSRAAYAILEDRKVDLRRAEYPMDETIQAVEDSPLPKDVKRYLIDIYRNGGVNRS